MNCGAGTLRATAAAGAFILSSGVAAEANVTISTHATMHMQCSGGVCSPTGAKAVLNVNELETMLASGAVTVTSSAAAPDILVEAGVSWANTNMLTFESYHSLVIDRTIDATAGGCLWIYTNQGGSGGVLTFGQNGNVHFWQLPTSTLQINDVDYTAVNDLPALASAIAADAHGNYALSAGYNAAGDGIYAQSPIVTPFFGRFEGLGNTISRLTIRHGNRKLGLFQTIETGGSAENISLTLEHIHATGTTKSFGGGLAAINNGTIFNAHASGKISTTGTGGTGGALVGVNNGTIIASSTNATPQNGEACVGGLVGINTGTISQSFAQGKAIADGPGGIACENSGTISDTYSLVNVTGRNASPYPGGLVGLNEASGTLSTSYAAGQITAVSNFGGVAGTNSGSLSQVYWDIEFTGAGPGFGCGSGSCSGATGLEHSQIQASLPAGFDPAIWGLSPTVNSGWPYLLANPPR